jgi:hypothetical protein
VIVGRAEVRVRVRAKARANPRTVLRPVAPTRPEKLVRTTRLTPGTPPFGRGRAKVDP